MIQISNKILIQCIMLNREITHKVKTDSLSKTQFIAQTKCSLCCDSKETYVKTKKKEVL